MKGYYAVGIAAENKRYDKPIDMTRRCRSRKEAIEVKAWLDGELSKAIEDQDSMVRIDLPTCGKQIPRTLFIRPVDYSVISTSVVFMPTSSCKGKIGFQNSTKKGAG